MRSGVTSKTGIRGDLYTFRVYQRSVGTGHLLKVRNVK